MSYLLDRQGAGGCGMMGGMIDDADFVYKISNRRRKRIYKRDGGICRYCTKKIDISECHMDHVIPWSKMGLSNDKNMVTSCATCNLKKGDKLVSEAGMELHEPLIVFTRKELIKLRPGADAHGSRIKKWHSRKSPPYGDGATID